MLSVEIEATICHSQWGSSCALFLAHRTGQPGVLAAAGAVAEPRANHATDGALMSSLEQLIQSAWITHQ